MEIKLCESDGFLHGGKAEIIVIQVTLNSGKKVQFPYPANKPIWKIYEAVSKISDENVVAPIQTGVSTLGSPVAEAGVSLVSSASSPNEIGREDLVRCVKVHDRGKGATIDLKVGDIYRVLQVKKSNGHVNSYDVIDDNADTQRRIFVLPDEVVFHMKRKPPVPKFVGKKGKSGSCNSCKAEMVFYKDDDNKYRGNCISCNSISELEDEPVATAPQDLQPTTA